MLPLRRSIPVRRPLPLFRQHAGVAGLGRTRGIRRRRLLLRGGIGLLVLLVASLQVAAWRAGGSDRQRFHQKTFEVTAVPRGDVLIVDRAGERVEVRLMGLDSGNSPAAIEAGTEMTVGKTVRLMLEEVPTRDSAGRLMAYAFLDDDTLLNHELVAAGWAFADRRYDCRYGPMLQAAEDDARRKRRGLWADVQKVPMPEWRRRWLGELGKPPWERADWRRDDDRP